MRSAALSWTMIGAPSGASSKLPAAVGSSARASAERNI
jgi:hypothetical protein